MKISVLIINYKTYNLLENCLLSLQEHTRGVNYEVIVVDNASDEKQLTGIRDKYPPVKFIPVALNIGFAAANNLGALSSTGEYLLILNNDTIFIENSLKILADYMDELNEECVVGCRLLNSDGTFQESAVEADTVLNKAGETFFLYKIFKRNRYLNKYYLNYCPVSEVVETDYVKGAFMFMRRETFTRLSGFDERFHFFAEEADFCIRFKKEGNRVLFYPFTSIIHLGGATTDLTPWFMYKNMHIAIISLFQKNYSLPKRAILIFIYEIGRVLRVVIFTLLGIVFLRKSLFLKSLYFFRQLLIYPKNKFKITR